MRRRAALQQRDEQMAQHSLSDEADAAIRAGDIQRAHALLEQHLAATAPRPSDYLKLAAARGALGDMAGSLEALTHELEVAPGSLPALLMRGGLLAAMGRTGEASAAYETALIQRMDDSRASPAMPDQAAAADARRARLEGLTFDDLALDAPARARAEQFRDTVLAANAADARPGDPRALADLWALERPGEAVPIVPAPTPRR